MRRIESYLKRRLIHCIILIVCCIILIARFTEPQMCKTILKNQTRL
uniref:Uncharacterized protein n=1 Tax=Rhizophora mucronata TaxID=61149 RepID=A0A2P2Q9T7_RHIMU